MKALILQLHCKVLLFFDFIKFVVIKLYIQQMVKTAQQSFSCSALKTQNVKAQNSLQENSFDWKALIPPKFKYDKINPKNFVAPKNPFPSPPVINKEGFKGQPDSTLGSYFFISSCNLL